MLNIDRSAFKRAIKQAPFGGKLSTTQWNGVEAVLDAWDEFGDADPRKASNTLAQTFHESGATMAPVRETFAKSDAAAMRNLENAWKAGKLPSVKKPYWRDGWFGRGLLQLTHEYNYAAAGAEIGVDLVADPSKAMDLVTSARIAVVGMLKGIFTKKKLSDYFSKTKDDPIGARRIVNGQDKAAKIAGYHRAFLAAMLSSMNEEPQSLADVGASKRKAPQDITDEDTVKSVQTDLRDLKYFAVGTPDGELGDNTKDAIMAFRRRNSLPINTRIDDELLAAIAKAKPKELPARSEASTEKVAAALPAVRPTLRNRLVGFWGTIVGIATAAASAVGDFFEDVWEKLEPIRDAMESVPGWCWFAVAGGICFFIYLNSRSSVDQTKAAFKDGQIM